MIKMKIIAHKTTFVTWLARGLSFFFAIFISLFASDTFYEKLEFWDKALELLLHLTPTFLVLLVLLVSWYQELTGSIIYSLLSMMYIIIFWGRFNLIIYLIISGVLFLNGVLFYISWRQNRNSTKT
jgi:hypothetical protein